MGKTETQFVSKQKVEIDSNKDSSKENTYDEASDSDLENMKKKLSLPLSGVGSN